MRAVRQPDRARGARDLLHGDAVLQIAEPRPAPLLLDGDAVDAKGAEFGPKVARKRVALVDLVGARRDLVGGETAHALAQHVGGLTEIKVEAAHIVDEHLRSFLRKADSRASFD